MVDASDLERRIRKARDDAQLRLSKVEARRSQATDDDDALGMAITVISLAVVIDCLNTITARD